VVNIQCAVAVQEECFLFHESIPKMLVLCELLKCSGSREYIKTSVRFLDLSNPTKAVQKGRQGGVLISSFLML
ncbi:MAG: hypothetical protein R6V27_08720, partial [Balneolaceae bacterium]